VSTVIEPGQLEAGLGDNRECYHCAATIPSSSGRFRRIRPRPTARAPLRTRDGGEWAHWESSACRADFIGTEQSNRTVRTPAARGAVSFTMSAKPPSQTAGGFGYGTGHRHAADVPLSHDLESRARRPRHSFRVLPISPTQTPVDDQVAGASRRGRRGWTTTSGN